MGRKKTDWITICVVVVFLTVTLNQFLLLEILRNTSSSLEGNQFESFVNSQESSPQYDINSGVLERKSSIGLNFKLLLFVTTHMCDSHIFFIKACWPSLLQNSLLIRSADVLVHMGYDSNINEEENDRDKRLNEQKNLFKETFHDQNIKIHTVPNIGYQTGAMKALTDASTEGWFDGYDWVIRLNPDVIIRNETFLINVMENDPNATALLINCFHDKKSLHVHTDFFAIKPSVLPKDAFMFQTFKKAELSFTAAIKVQILDKGGHRWIPGAEPGISGICRAGNKNKMTESTIVHVNLDVTTLKTGHLACPIPL